MGLCGLAFSGNRYLKKLNDDTHEHEYFPIKLEYRNFKKSRDQFVSAQNSFEELTRGLSQVQIKAMKDVMAQVTRLEKENQGLLQDVFKYE